MEEDIKVLEEMLDIDKHLGKFLSDNRRQAIENLIKGYKELQEKIDDLLSQNEMFKDMYDEEVYKNKKLEEENARLKAHKNSYPVLPTTGVECKFKKVREYLNKMEKRCDKPKFSVMKKEIEEILQEGDDK